MSRLQISPKTITLRPRTPADEAFLRLAYETSRDEEFKTVEWPNAAQREVFFRHQFDSQELHFASTYPEADYDIIEYKKEPIGRLILSWEADQLHCIDIILLPGFRKKKFGTAIMNAITKEADRLHIPASLFFERWKPYLEPFYESYGFVTKKEHPAHFYMERERR
jgi:GNAT superfamily N-acetyltransferase